MKSTERLTKFVKNSARLDSIRTRRLLRALPVHQRILMKTFSNFCVSKVYLLGIFGSGIRKEKPDIPYGD